MKRVFLIVLDSFGIGYEPDAGDFGDVGADTLARISTSEKFNIPNLSSLGLPHIDGVRLDSKEDLKCAVGRMREVSRGKDTTIGHWELTGIISENPLPTYPHGFPDEILKRFSERTGRGVLCNLPYSGTEVIAKYGDEHMRSGDLIVYTSADSVFQIAAHESLVSREELYRYCEIAREILKDEHGVGRVIARPFDGEYPFKRTSGRHDFSLIPPALTVPEILKNAGYDSISVGKIYDIFAGVGFTESHPTVNNGDGCDKSVDIMKRDFNGLCFINLVDFDMVYGHRNNLEGYARALTDFDTRLGEMLPLLREDDMLIITADHGCDPSTPSTDHSREYTPMVAYGKKINGGVNLGTRESFADIGATVLEWFGEDTSKIYGNSFLKEILK